VNDHSIIAGEEICDKIYAASQTECVLLFSSIGIELCLHHAKPATKKCLNGYLYRAEQTRAKVMSHLLQREYEAARDVLQPFTEGAPPCMWLCRTRDETAARIASIYDELGKSSTPIDAYDHGGRGHVGTATFWIDR
jgi:hypothetical protein